MVDFDLGFGECTRVHIIAISEFGQLVINKLPQLETENVTVEYIEEGESSKCRDEKANLVILISDEFNESTRYYAENAEACLVLGCRATKGFEAAQHNFVYLQSITEYRALITMLCKILFNPGLISVDFADIKNVLKQGKIVTAVSAYCVGDTNSSRAEQVTKMALEKLAFHYVEMQDVKGCVINISCGEDFSFNEYQEIGHVVSEKFNNDCLVIVGTSFDVNIQGIRVDLFVTR